MRAMKNLRNPVWIGIKAGLFLFLALLSGAVQLLEHPTLKSGLPLAVTVWAFCRFYYFAFYVIEHYVDPTYRFTGFLSFARYLVGRR